VKVDESLSARARTSRSALLAVVAGGNVAGIAAVAAIWALRRHHLIAGPPYWVFMVMMLASITLDLTSGIWYRRRPDSRVREQTRIVLAAAGTTTILYASGWGALLGIAYALLAVQLLAQLRGIDWRIVFVWCFAGIFVGEVAVELGIAPTMVSYGGSHMIAGAALALLAAVLWVVSGTFAARDAIEQEVRERERLLVHEVATDSLTQLLNRAAFTDALERSCAAHEAAIIAFVDLDNFKHINDSFGHHIGDAVLVEVAARLRQVVRAEDVIARFGGDEFVILVRSSRDAAEASRLVERIWAVLAQPWPIIAPNTVSASVGVVDDDGSRSPDDLLRQADQAMYARKHGLSSAGSMTTMTSRALAHHRLAMDGMRGSFAVLRAVREAGEIVDFEVVEANSRVRAVFGKTTQQVVGARLSNLYTPDSYAAFLPLYHEVVSTGKPVNREVLIVRPSGENLWLGANIITVDRDVIAVVANDITAEVQARNDRAQERERFASLVAHSSDLACIVDGAGEIVYSPPRGTEFLGYANSELGAPLSRVDPADAGAATAWFSEMRSLPSGTEGRSVALRFTAYDGSVHTCDVTAENRTGERAVGGIVLNAHDVTALVAAEARLAAVADAVADVIAICDAAANITWVSSAVRTALGLEPDDLIGRSGFDIIHPDDVTYAATRLLRFVDDKSVAPPIEIRVRHADGSYRWFECSGNNQIDDPEIRGLVVSLRDSTERRSAEAALRMSEQRNRSIVETAADAIISVDPYGMIQSFNRSAEVIFATRAVDAIGEYYGRFLPEDSLEIVRSALEYGGVSPQIDTIATRASGERFAAQVAVSDVLVGETHFYTAVVRDISAQRAMEQALRIAAAFDELTGLPNRRTLLDRAEDAIEQARRTDDVVGMVFVDLDRFKLVNDGLGHDAGDQLLVCVADRIAHAVRSKDVVARLGSDEFVVLCPSASDLDAIKAVALRIVEALTGAFLISGDEVFIGASIGISVSTGEESPIELLRFADTAMYRAKADASSQVEVFDSRMQLHAARRLNMESALRHASARGEMLAYYQPIVDLYSEEVSYLEALLRWDRPGIGIVRPDNFIPVAEDSGIILELGAWMLRRATADCAHWQSIAPGVGVAVNVSVRQFESGDLVHEVQDALARSGLAPELLTVEITESVMLEHSNHNATIMRRVRDLGVHMSLDDFGSGYSSLTYLRLLPIDSIKIDRSFLQSLGSASRDHAMLSAIVNLGTAHDLVVVAEGVDSREKVDAVQAAGCHFGQGFLFSRPLPLRETLTYLDLEHSSRSKSHAD